MHKVLDVAAEEVADLYPEEAVVFDALADSDPSPRAVLRAVLACRRRCPSARRLPSLDVVAMARAAGEVPS